MLRGEGSRGGEEGEGFYSGLTGCPYLFSGIFVPCGLSCPGGAFIFLIFIVSFDLLGFLRFCASWGPFTSILSVLLLG